MELAWKAASTSACRFHVRSHCDRGDDKTVQHPHPAQARHLQDADVALRAKGIDPDVLGQPRVRVRRPPQRSSIFTREVNFGAT